MNSFVVRRDRALAKARLEPFGLLTQSSRPAIPPMSLIARESSGDSSLTVRRTPKEQPPRNLSGPWTAWIDSDALERVPVFGQGPPKG